MREIKFRARRRDGKGWEYYLLPKHAVHIHRDIFSKLVEETLYQYTGLKDKNGKEIYEGDVVKYQKTFPNSGNPITKKYQYEIKWDDNLDIDGGSDLLNGVGFRNVHSGLEVIGNIYENPELLNV